MTVGRRQFLTSTALGFAATGILTASPARRARAQSKGKIKITASYGQVSLLNSAIWIAKDKGFFDKHGLDVELVQLLGPRITQGLLSNSVQFIFSTAASPFLARAAGADMLLLGSFLNKVPIDIIGDASVKTFADAKGKVFAIDLTGDFGEFLVRVAMKESGANPDLVTFVQGFDTDGSRIAAVTSGSANMAIASLEVREIYQKAGLHLLFSVFDSDVEFATRGIFTTGAYAKKNPEVVRSFLMAMTEANLYFKNNKAGSLEVVNKYATTPPEANSAYYDIYSKAMSSVPDVSEELVKASIAPHASEPKFASLKPDYFYDPSFVQDIQKSGFFKEIGAQN